jgi:signal transduction histidine kinase
MQIQHVFPPELYSTSSGYGSALFSNRNNPNRSFEWQEISVIGKDGNEIPVRFSRALLHRNDQVIGCVCFFSDLREIKRLQKELIENERLLAIGQTVAGLAHCIKNILVGLEAGNYVVEKGLRKNDLLKVQKGWDIVQNNVHKISSLASDLLIYSKERKPARESCVLNALAGEVCDLMEPKAKKHGIIIEREFDPEIGRIRIDANGIYRCLMNQVSNAVDACVEDKDEKKNHKIKITTYRESEQSIVCEVSDNGCGMDDKIQKQIFTGFFSTKGSKGTGLGLIVTQKILQEHGGSISVRSEPGNGATFTSKIPC